MSDYTPITQELKTAMVETEGDHALRLDVFNRCCAEIDALHKNLEDENQRLRDKARHNVGTCYVDVLPRIDWERMACEFEQFAEVVRSMARDDESAPTIESLLREYTEKLCDLCATEYACDTTREELMRQYADKLRYVGGE